MQKADPSKGIVQLLATVNRLQIKAFNAVSRESLTFIILNDTYQVFKYDRSLLWDLEEGPPKLIGVSGQHKVYKETELSQKWSRLTSHLKDPSEPQLLTAESFTAEQPLWNEIFPHKETLVYWVPIKTSEKLRLGFWLEIWHPDQRRVTKDDLTFLSTSLMPAYASAWAKFDKAHYIKPLIRNRKLWYYAIITLLVILFGVRIPLRVAAPCEIVPANPIVVTAPLDGIIHEVLVKPGQEVHTGEILFDYDKRIPTEELNVAQKQVEIAQAEVNRANTLGLADQKSLAELEILKLKLQKDQIALDLAQSQVKKLEVKAPDNGVVIIDDPEEWMGKPVKIGEKVLTISNPSHTKLRFWVPEDDNILIDKSKPITVFLDIAPERALKAKLNYISYESSIGTDQIPSFMGEATWETPPKDIKLGLTGTAVLYGERVSLFYFIVRKPWSTLRRVTGF